MLERLRRLFGPGADAVQARGADCRWVVLDVETSGLDPASDTLLAVGAVAVRAGRIDVADSLELLVRPPRASGRDSILVHGIGEAAQRGGLPPEQACRELVEYLDGAPLVAFHASFDRAFLERATRAFLGQPLRNEWLDLAELAPALHAGAKARALDDWLSRFGITVDQRHHASSDALATAMLFLRLLSGVPAGQRDPRSLRKLAAAARWVPR